MHVKNQTSLVSVADESGHVPSRISEQAVIDPIVGGAPKDEMLLKLQLLQVA